MTSATAPALSSPTTSAKSNRALQRRLPSVAFAVGWLALWQIVSQTTTGSVPSPLGVVVAGYEIIFEDNILLPALMETLQGLAVGFAITVVLGIPIGFAMGRSKLMETILEPYVTMLYATPRIALIPILVLWAGIGFELRVTVVVLSAIFPLILNVYRGSQQIDEDLIDVGRSVCAGRLQMIRTIVLPASVPYLMAGLRLAMGRALIGIMTAEMAASLTGTGALIISFGRYLQTDRLLVPIIALGFLAIALQKLMVTIERRVTRWRTEEAT